MGVRVTLSTNHGVNTVVRGLPQTLYGMKRLAMSDSISAEQMLEQLADEWKKPPSKMGRRFL